MTALYRKHRPQELSDLVGNNELVEQLQSIIDRPAEDRPQAYLLAGSTGCGKTTIARILASELDCNDADFMEFNSANTRGIDTAREINATINYKPLSGGKVKIYLLDEVHQATKDFQNAILKLLEDTPKHVIFILCTTNQEKLIPTVRNRCTSFDVQKLSSRNILKLLQQVTKKEDKSIPISALKQIAEMSNGIPRAALTILDKVIDLEPEKLEQEVRQIVTNEKSTIDLCRALLEGKQWNVLYKIIKSILDQNEPETVRQGVLSYMSKVLLSEKPDPKASEIIINFENDFFSSGKAGLVNACFLLTL